MSPDWKRQTDQPISGGDTLPEEGADQDQTSAARAAKVAVTVALGTPVPMLSPGKAETGLEGKYSVVLMEERLEAAKPVSLSWARRSRTPH